MTRAEPVDSYVPGELPPDVRAETRLQDIRDVTRLALAESSHPLTRDGLRAGVRDRLDARVYKRSLGRVDTVVDQENLCSTMAELAFQEGYFRLTPAGLRMLEDEKPAYRRKCSAAVRELAATAEERVPLLRPGLRDTRVELEETPAGPAVIWTNGGYGLMRYDAAGLTAAEVAGLPKDHRRYGTLYLVVRRLELHLGVDSHAEELLVFNYRGRDEDVGRRAYGRQETPSMHAEVRRDRVPLGVLRQLTAELAGQA